MEVDNNGLCGDESRHKPVDEDCNKWTMDNDCQACAMMVECYESNGYEMPEGVE
jgi:hypothetical protein